MTTQPVEQNITQVSLPSIPSDRMMPATTKDVSSPAGTKSEVSVPQTASTPAPADEPATFPAERSSTSTRPHLGRATAQIWIGSPPVDDIASMFPPEHREKIKDVSVHKPTDPNSKYALVYFHSVEDASAAIETLDHPKVKFGTDFSTRSQGRGGSFSSRGSYSQGSYDARKSGLSESDRGGFGRGGRGGRGGLRGAGSSGSFNRGSSSPGPNRGVGPSRGRGGISSSYSQRDVPGDKQEWQNKPDNNDASWPTEEKAPVPPSTEAQNPRSEPATAATATTTAASTAGASTVGESHQSSP